MAKVDPNESQGVSAQSLTSQEGRADAVGQIQGSQRGRDGLGLDTRGKEGSPGEP